jgi:hypothetical protein
MAPFALLIIPGRRDPPLCIASQDFFLAIKGVSIALWGARVRGVSGLLSPFETVPVTKGYTNKIQLKII